MRQRPGIASPYLPDADWSVGDVLLALFAGFGGALVAGAYLAQTRGSAPVGVGDLAVTVLAQAVATLSVVAALSRRRGTGDWRRDFGLRLRLGDVWGLAGGLGLQLGSAFIVGPLVELVAPDEIPRQSLVEVGERVSGGGSVLVFLFLVVVVAPLVEETVFRGMLLSRLRRSMAPWRAIVVSAAAFAALHLLDPNALYAVPGLFVVGIALGWLALRTGDLSLPIFVHAGVNLTGAVVLLFGDELLEMTEQTATILLAW